MQTVLDSEADASPGTKEENCFVQRMLNFRIPLSKRVLQVSFVQDV